MIQPYEFPPLSAIIAELTINGAGTATQILDFPLVFALQLLEQYGKIRRARLADMALAVRAANAEPDDFKKFMAELRE